MTLSSRREAVEAINLSLLAVTKPGDTIAIESQTFYSTLMAIERMQLRAVEIATDPREGIDLGNFRAALDRYDIKACHHNSNVSATRLAVACRTRKSGN